MQDKFTALHWAAAMGRLTTVKELVEAGATQLKNKVSVQLQYIIQYNTLHSESHFLSSCTQEALKFRNNHMQRDCKAKYM